MCFVRSQRSAPRKKEVERGTSEPGVNGDRLKFRPTEMHREHAQPVLRCLALSEHLQSRPTCSTRPSRDYRARSMHSQSHFRKSLNLRRNGDFWQQIGKVHSPTRRNGVICPPTKRSDVYVSQSAYSGNCSGSDIGRRDGLCAFDRHRLRRRPLSSSHGEIALRCSGSHDPIDAGKSGINERG